MAAKVNVVTVGILDNPAPFLSPFKLEITFEVFENLPDDLEWKLTYVGSAETEEHDQQLDSVLVGPVPEGRHKFVFEAPAPDVARLPEGEVVGVTVVLLTCAYRGADFIKIGYFVSNDYTDADMRDNPPERPHVQQLQRTIVGVDEPRVTRFVISWDDGAAVPAAGDAATPSAKPTQPSPPPSVENGAPLANVTNLPAVADAMEQ